MDISVKASLRNFMDVKARQDNASLLDSTNIIHHLTGISKIMEDAVVKFTKRYLIISTELEEMKREFIGQASLVNEYVNLTKREIRFDKFDKYQTPSLVSIPGCPNYEQKILKKESKKNSTAAGRSKKEGVFNSEKKMKNSQRGAERQNTGTKIPNHFNQANSTINHSNQNSNLYSNQNQQQNQTNDGTKPLSRSLIKNFIQGAQLENKKQNKDSFGNRNAINQINKSKGKEGVNSQSLQESSTNEKEEYHKKVIESFDDDFFKAIYILANSAILTIDERMKLCSINKDIASKINPSEIINDSLTVMNTRIKKLEKMKESTPEPERKIIETLCSYPTKTAQTGLNFLTSEREENLIETDTEVNIQLIKMILACLEEDNIEYYSVAEAYECLFKKYNVNSIKSLFLDVIYRKIYIDNLDRNDFDMQRVIEEIEANSDLITNSLVNNTNKTFSYIAFSLEEINQHLKNLSKAGRVTLKKIKNELELKELKNKYEALCEKIR